MSPYSLRCLTSSSLLVCFLGAPTAAADEAMKASDPPDHAWTQGPGSVLSRVFRTIPGDLVALTTAPFQDAKADGVVFGSLLVLVATDQPSTKFLQTHVAPKLAYTWSGPNLGITHLNGADGYLVAFLPACYLGSLAADHSQGQIAALLSIKAGAYAVLYAQLLGKSLSGRNRPNPDLASGQPAESPYTNNPWDWGHVHRPYPGPNGDATAFPSFHYTLYFAVASVFAHVYETPWVPYGLAAVALGANFKSHHHWVSDSVAGAALGIGIGQVTVGEFYKTSPSGNRGLTLSLQPAVGMDGGYGMALKATW